MKRKQTYLGKIFHVTEEDEDIVDAVLTKGSTLGADRILFESADFDIKGDAILQRHENLSPDSIPERLRIDNIQLRHPKLSPDEAEKYKALMLKADFTSRDAINYTDSLIRKSGFCEAISWLEKIATEMDECRPKDDLEEEICKRAKRGWLIPYLAAIDYAFSKRWDYWTSTIKAGKVLDQPIPQIEWLSTGHDEPGKNLEKCIKLCDNRFTRNALDLFTDWLLHAFADPSIGEMQSAILNVSINKGFLSLPRLR